MAILVNRQFDSDKDEANNRQKFIRRNKKAIKEALKHVINTKSITNIDKEGTEVTIQDYDLDEPSFTHKQGTGTRDYVIDGNKTFDRGKRWPKDKKGGGGSSDEGGNSDNGEVDTFSFLLTREEFIEFFLADLKLPDLVKTAMGSVLSDKNVRAGYTKDGMPSNLDIRKTFRNAIARRKSSEHNLKEALKQAKEEDNKEDTIELEEKLNSIPYLNDVDLRYRYFTNRPEPIKKAVMFCLMDVSASMGEEEKDIAKRFFLLLYLFLTNTYKHVEIVFIRHTSQAQEVDENTFFYGKESGGTVISSGYKLIHELIQTRFSPSDWNIYISQVSDGDNFEYDSEDMVQELTQHLLPVCQYFAYIEPGAGPRGFFGVDLPSTRESMAWHLLQPLLDSSPNLAMRKIEKVTEIYKVFRGLFNG